MKFAGLLFLSNELKPATRSVITELVDIGLKLKIISGNYYFFQYILYIFDYKVLYTYPPKNSCLSYNFLNSLKNEN